MPLKKIVFRPGLFRDATNYANEGGWYDGDHVRFRAGFPEKIGGWRRATQDTFLGTCRALHEWMTLDGNRFLAVGTHLKYYLYWGDSYYDITPIRSADIIGMDPFETAGGTSLIVTHTGHNATANDFVTFTGANDSFDVDDRYTPDILNREYQIVEIISSSTYRIQTTVEGSAPGISGGGGPVTATYQIYTALDIAVPGTGWGASPWGGGITGGAVPSIGWGEEFILEDTGNIPYSQIRLWSQDNFGEDLIFNARNGGIFYWDRTTGVLTRAVELSQMTGALEAPTWAFEILISEGDRHVVAIGTNDIGEDFLDPLMVRWSTAENALDWEPRRDNTAGSYRLSSGSSISAALRTRQETLIWTEKNLQSMRFIGPPYVFGFNLIAENVSILSPAAGVNAGGRVFWMDRNTFFVYAGQVQELACPVSDYVFSDFNMTQRLKVHAGHNHNFNEIIWFYPSSAAMEIDRYVLYNYVDQTWAFGTIERTCWIDQVWGGSYPVATKDGILYHHEFGHDADNEPLPAWIQSSDTALEDGERFTFLRRVIPDIQFRGTAETQAVGITLMSRRAPGDFYDMTARAQITPYTNSCWVRTRGRHFAIRIQSDSIGTGWRAGAMRFDAQPDGKR